MHTSVADLGEGLWVGDKGINDLTAYPLTLLTLSPSAWADLKHLLIILFEVLHQTMQNTNANKLLICLCGSYVRMYIINYYWYCSYIYQMYQNQPWKTVK